MSSCLFPSTSSDTHYYVFSISNDFLCRSQWPCGLRFRSAAARLLWDCGFESHGKHGCLSVVSVVCCQVEVSATGWSLVQRSPTDCGASLCDLETSGKRRPRSTGGCCAKKKKNYVKVRIGPGSYKCVHSISDSYLGGQGFETSYHEGRVFSQMPNVWSS